ncbi:MAG: CehA/McbA family metallohydrolase, partial [Cyclobacteriaceae bacterium]|nr:CehA/McbA family metallohydrolase [Cyclobacteriaceae bacterium]
MIRQKRLSILILLIFLVAANIQSQNPVSSLKVKITDQNSDNPIPVRVKITDLDGNVTALPGEVISVMYGRDDRPERYSYQPDSSFYVDGMFSIDLEEGTYNLQLSKGVEYIDQTHTLELKAGEQKELTFEMKRWVNMAQSGWYSADDHIHIRRSPRENPLILKWIEAEGLNVGVMLQMGDFHTTYFSQYAFGEEGVYKENESMLSTGQEEPRTHEIGHTIAMVADDFVRFRDDYYYYDKVCDRVHELNGIMGYAHQGMSFHGSRGMTMDVLDDKVDFLELLQFCVAGGPLLTQNYYHYLDLGYKLTATAGSDFPWCGNGPRFGTEGPSWNARIGNVRFYTHLDGEFNYPSWKEN